MQEKKRDKLLLHAVLILIAIAPIIYFKQIENVPYKAFILGTGSWGFGGIFKIVAHQIIIKRLHKKKISLIITSVANGFISGFFELSAAYILILFMKDKFEFDYNAIISFGLAIGSFECLLVVISKGNDLFKGTTLEDPSGRLTEYLDNLHGAQYYFFNLTLPITERIMATFLHISTRGLVFITIFSGNFFPIVIALCVFIIADGLLGYYYYLSGKLATKEGYIQIHLYLFIITTLSSAIFFILIIPYKNFVF